MGGDEGFDVFGHACVAVYRRVRGITVVPEVEAVDFAFKLSCKCTERLLVVLNTRILWTWTGHAYLLIVLLFLCEPNSPCRMIRGAAVDEAAEALSWRWNARDRASRFAVNEETDRREVLKIAGAPRIALTQQKAEEGGLSRRTIL